MPIEGIGRRSGGQVVLAFELVALTEPYCPCSMGLGNLVIEMCSSAEIVGVDIAGIVVWDIAEIAVLDIVEIVGVDIAEIAGMEVVDIAATESIATASCRIWD